jgi:hypothetical protein
MIINIKNIIESNIAAFHNEGLQIFSILEKSYSKGQQVTVSFEGLKHCSTQFLNAAIGKMYLQYNPALLNNLLRYNFGDLQNMEAKVEEVKENAINSKEYDSLLENAIA